MSIFINDLVKTTDTKYTIGYIHYMPFNDQNGLGKNREELEREGILIEDVPIPSKIAGKQSILYYNPIEKKLFYEYEDSPKLKENIEKEGLEERIEALEQSNAELTTLISTMSTPQM